MAVFRFVAVVLIVLGLMMLGADVVTMLERGEEPHLRTLADFWALFSGLSAEAFNAVIVEIVPAPVADWILAGLAVPAFAFFLGLGVVLAFFFRQNAEPE